MYLFSPFKIYASPFLIAVDFIPPIASLPALGSVIPIAPSASPDIIGFRYFSFCFSVPKWMIGAANKFALAP